jgi:hypothetical protein
MRSTEPGSNSGSEPRNNPGKTGRDPGAADGHAVGDDGSGQTCAVAP